MNKNEYKNYMDRHWTDRQTDRQTSKSFSESIGVIKDGSILSLFACYIQPHRFNTPCAANGYKDIMNSLSRLQD